ncbi:MAG: hypothetical protein ABW134_15400 [Candidatus Thiodiazotropha endolucinida]
MTNNMRTKSLDEVLANYAQASQEFDAKVLQAFIDKYPEYTRALQRYAHIQLTSRPATPEEIDAESLSDEEMLQRQSKLLQRMQQLRGAPSSSDTSEAFAKLASISGEQSMREAAIAVFGSCEHGEDLLLLSVMETTSEVSGIPDWFYEELGAYIDVTPAALIDGMALKRQQPIGLQRFSSKEKPTELPATTWEQIVEDCITDDTVKDAVLKR